MHSFNTDKFWNYFVDIAKIYIIHNYSHEENIQIYHSADNAVCLISYHYYADEIYFFKYTSHLSQQNNRYIF